MTTKTDSSDTTEYKSTDVDLDTTNAIKTVTIPGKIGVQTKISGVSYQIANSTNGVASTILISFTCNGKTTAYDNYGTATTDYKTRTYSNWTFTGDAGKDVVISWKLITGSSASPAKVKGITYTYDAGADTVTPTPTPTTTYILIAKYTSRDAALADLAKVKGTSTSASIADSV